jgi:hypothetical protein
MHPNTAERTETDRFVLNSCPGMVLVSDTNLPGCECALTSRERSFPFGMCAARTLNVEAPPPSDHGPGTSQGVDRRPIVYGSPITGADYIQYVDTARDRLYFWCGTSLCSAFHLVCCGIQAHSRSQLTRYATIAGARGRMSIIGYHR